MNNNPLKITNSQLAQVQSFQKQMIENIRKQFKNLSESEDFYTNIIMATKFSIARQFDRKQTIQMWLNWVKWYQQFQPGKISENQPLIQKLHQSGKYRFCGHDKNGCPILVIQMKYHIKGLATAEENLRYLIFMIEKGRKLANDAKTYQLSVIFDRREMAESDDVSKESMKLFMPILNDYYPQMLKSFYVLGANIFYRAMWKIVSIFVSKRTEEKINLLEDQAKLTQFIEQSNLAKQYGGDKNIEK